MIHLHWFFSALVLLFAFACLIIALAALRHAVDDDEEQSIVKRVATFLAFVIHLALAVGLTVIVLSRTGK